MNTAPTASLFAQNFEGETETNVSAVEAHEPEAVEAPTEVTQAVDPVDPVAPEVRNAADDGEQETNPVNVNVAIPDNLTYEQMEAARQALAQKMAEAREKQRAADLNTVKALVARHGFSAADLHLKKPSKSKNPTGKTVPPKYRNPEDPSQVWTGRGIAPTWIRDVSNEDREKFLIK